MKIRNSVMNKELRRRIIEMAYEGKDGHIPSAFSIVDIVSLLYGEILNVSADNPDDPNRDIFVLSKGHGCLAHYVTLHREGFLSDDDLKGFCRSGGILGEHPDCTKIPGVEASTGSLGHGFPFSTGLALGQRVKKRPGRVYTLVGDGESHEGTIWESAHLAANLQLGKLCVIVDWNRSGQQLLPVDDVPRKWAAFGWDVIELDGHDEGALRDAFRAFEDKGDSVAPTVIVANTTKGRGVPMIEGHGPWHHRIPNEAEYAQIMEALA